MSKLAVKMLMMWLLVGPPALCRAGVLIECCDHEPLRDLRIVATTEPPCCDNENPTSSEDLPDSESGSRTCGACAGVCATVAKPSDGLDVTTLADVALPIPGVIAPTRAHHASQILAGSPLSPYLPFPPSDLPLLI